MDRAAMEAARLARQNARLGNAAPQAVTNNAVQISCASSFPYPTSEPLDVKPTLQKLKTEPIIPSLKRSYVVDLTDESEESSHFKKVAKPNTASSSSSLPHVTSTPMHKSITHPTNTTPLAYPSGAVRRTAVQGYPITNRHITIEQILQKDSLELAVMASYIFTGSWILDKINRRQTQVMLVLQSDRMPQYHNTPGDHPVKVILPDMTNVRCMHSKLQLLFHHKFLRIVVCFIGLSIIANEIINSYRSQVPISAISTTVKVG